MEKPIIKYIQKTHSGCTIIGTKDDIIANENYAIPQSNLNEIDDIFLL